jgi:hypothetical protein
VLLRSGGSLHLRQHLVVLQAKQQQQQQQQGTAVQQLTKRLLRKRLSPRPLLLQRALKRPLQQQRVLQLRRPRHLSKAPQPPSARVVLLLPLLLAGLLRLLGRC